MQDFLTLAIEAIATVSTIYFVAGFVAIAGRPLPLPTATQTETDEVEATVVCPTVEETAIATTTELTVSLLQVEELQTPSFQDAIVPFKTPLTRLTIRQLKQRAKTACIPRYSRMRKPQLITALQAL